MNVIQPAQLQDCDVLIYRGTHFISRAIQLIDGSEASHAGLYVAPNLVDEALPLGLKQQSLTQSCTGSQWVRVRRLKAECPTLAPVADRAALYMSRPNFYAYDQIVLLALLGLTRKIKFTPAVRALVRKVLDLAAGILLKWARNKVGLSVVPIELMICSEFVYRCYDEADPKQVDCYSLRVNQLADPAKSPALRLMGVARPVKGRGIERGALLDEMAGIRLRPMAMAGHDPAGLIRLAEDTETDLADTDLDTLIETYFAELSGEAVAPAPEVTDDQIMGAVYRFGQAHELAMRGTGSPAAPGALGFAGAAPDPLAHLLKTAADFVTPADLLQTPSLVDMGQLP